jgi:hypothetical protein
VQRWRLALGRLPLSCLALGRLYSACRIKAGAGDARVPGAGASHDSDVLFDFRRRFGLRLGASACACVAVVLPCPQYPDAVMEPLYTFFIALQVLPSPMRTCVKRLRLRAFDDGGVGALAL